jgi:hypothetical protein
MRLWEVPNWNNGAMIRRACWPGHLCYQKLANADYWQVHNTDTGHKWLAYDAPLFFSDIEAQDWELHFDGCHVM